MKQISVKSALVSLATFGVLIASPAEAFTCRANPSAYLATDAGGGVLVSVQDAGITTICSLSSTVRGASPQACAAWYSAFLTFRTTGKTALLHYDGSDGGTACTSYHNWEAHIPYFVLFE